MRRRRLLALAGAGAASALAGCGGNGSDGDGSDGGDGGNDADGGNDGTTDGPDGDGGGGTTTPSEPAFTVADVTGPETVPIGEPFTVTVTVENDGATGRFTGTVETDGPAPTTAEIDTEVPTGESVTVDVEIEPPQSLGTVTVSLAAADATHEVTVGPQQPDVGERVTLLEDVAFSFDAVTYPNSLLYEEPDRLPKTRVLTPPTDRRLVVVRATFENVGTTAVSLSGSLFGLDGGDLFAGLPGGVDLEEIEFEATAVGPEQTLRLPASESREVVMLGLVPSQREETPAVTYRKSTDADPVVRFGLPAPETGLSSFTLDDVDAPATAQQEAAYEITVTITNEGDPGTFRGVFQYEGDDEWIRLDTADSPRIRQEFAAGETRRITITNAAQVTGEFTYRLAPLTDTEWTTEIQ